jgi:hypothetical protein
VTKSEKRWLGGAPAISQLISAATLSASTGMIWESAFACLARTLLSAKVPIKPICAGVACRMVDAERAFSIVRYAPTGLT